MEAQNKVTLSMLVDDVPTDTSGKWVKKEELYAFASVVADYVLSRLENKTNDPTL